MVRIIPHLKRTLKDWRNYQWPMTNYEWASALHHAGFMNSGNVSEVEAILEAAIRRGEWEMDDPLSAASEFLIAAKHALIHDAMDIELHKAVAKALYAELFAILGISMPPDSWQE